MQERQRESRSAKRLAALFMLAFSLSSCAKEGQLDSFLDVPSVSSSAQTSPLLLTPNDNSLIPGAQVLFTASGGKPPYTYSLLIGGGSLNPLTGLYVASLTPGSAVVKATDSLGAIALASLTIANGGGGTPAGTLVISPLTKTLAVNNSFTFTATGGQTPYTFSVFSGVGNINSVNGNYSSASTGTSIVRVSDGLGSTADAAVIVNSALSLSTNRPVVSINNTASLLAAGGVAPYTYSLVSGSGSVSGSTYTSSGSSGAGNVRVTDSVGNSADTLITVNPALSLTPGSKSLAVNNPFTFSAAGGVTPYTYSVLAGGAGGTINASTGAYTAPSTSGSDTVRVTDSLGNTANSSVAVNAAIAISPITITLALNNNYTFTATGGVSPYSYSMISGVGSISSFSGTYSASSVGSGVIRVTDAEGNTSNASVTVNPALNLTAARTTLSINNSTALTASGGVAPYAYALSSGTGSVTGTTYTAPSSAGAANVRVTDARNNTSDVLITVTGALMIAPTTRTLAVGNSTSFNASGGVSPYSYSVVSGGAGGTVVSSTGVYTAPGISGSDTVRVTDALGNISNASVAINPSLSISPASLTLGLNNSSTFSGAGGVSPYTFSIASGVGSINAASGLYNATSTGSAVVRITDAVSNTLTANVAVSGGLAISLSRSVVAVGNTSALSATGGVSPYVYSLVAGSGSISGATYTAPMSAGSATIRVTDNLGTVNDAMITINPALTVSPSSRSLTTANTYTFNASGGVSPYTYTISSGTGVIGVSSGIFSSASAGTSTILVTDSLGNTTTATAIVTAALTISPATRTLTITNTTSFSASNGVSPYTFSIVPGGVGSINSTTGLYTAPASAGSATVQVTDAIGNTSNAAVTVNAALAITPSAYTLAVNNTTTFTGLGGVPPYTFTIFSGGGTVNSSGLFSAPASAGTSVVRVTDSASSTANATVTINAALSVSPSATTIAVNNTANLTPSGGVSPYTWSTNLGTVSSSGTFTAPASAGTATVTLADSVGNTRTAVITVNAALAISPTSASLAASGLTRTFTAGGGSGTYTYVTTIGTIGASSGILTPPASSGTGSVTVTDSLGNTSQSAITVNPGLAVSPTTKTLAVGNSFTLGASGGVAPLSYSIFSGGGSLASNVYTAPGSAGSAVVRVTDAVGNVVSCAITINAALSISPTSQILAVNNTRTFTASSGVSPYTFATNFGTINAFTGFYTAPASSGTGTVTVTDANGNTANAALTVNSALAINPATKTLLINDIFGFSASGGVSPYTYSVLAGTGSISSSSGVYTAGASTGSATVRVADSLGNSSNSTVTISAFSTSEDYQYTTNYASGLNGMVADSSGNIYTAGYGNDGTGVSHWIVKKSINSGTSWTVVDDYSYFTGQNSTANFIVANPAGTILFAGGSGNDSSGNTHWIVRTSSNGGTTWTTVDNYVYTAGRPSIARAAVVMPNGDLYVTGSGVGGGAQQWITRKLPLGGSWSVVDNYYQVPGYNALGYSISRDAFGNLYSGGYNGWYSTTTIRKSSDAGATWANSWTIGNGSSCSSCGVYSMMADSSNNIYASGSHGYYQNGGPFYSMKSLDSGSSWTVTLDSYNYPGWLNNTANITSVYSATLDSSNNVLNAGIVSDSTPTGHWFLRKSNQALSNTATIDDFQLTSTQPAAAKAVITLSSGKILVGGYALDATGVSHWMIRSF